MSELKEHLFVPYSELQEGDELTDAITTAKSYYLKSEADKVIADLEESHKMEVKQLLIEIKRLENLCASYRHDCDNLAIREANALKEIGRDNRVIRHQKYKRCLAMASYWVAVSYQCVDDKHRQNAERHHRKWLELANKFEEIK